MAEDDQALLTRTSPPDYRLIFDAMPGMCLILDTTFKIVAQNEEHARATLTTGMSVIGKALWEAFPDNPADLYESGISAVRQSLLNVLKTRKRDVMPIIRYDVQPIGGAFEERYWVITNSPVLGSDGFVHWIINRAEDVTELVKLRKSAEARQNVAP
jgi:PAS domain-containing protein